MARKKSSIFQARLVVGRAFLSPKAHLLFWPIFAAAVALDLWTKRAVFDWLSTFPIPFYKVVDGFLNFIMAENNGAAWSIMRGQRILLSGISIVALAVVLGIFLFSRNQRRLVQISLALFAGGISGNLYDRLFNDGKVRDFIDVVYWPGRHWPAFNVADSLLCTAVGLLIILTLFSHDKPVD